MGGNVTRPSKHQNNQNTGLRAVVDVYNVLCAIFSLADLPGGGTKENWAKGVYIEVKK